MPSENEISLKVFIPRTLIKRATDNSVIALTAYILLENNFSVQSIERDNAASTKHDKPSDIVDLRALKAHQLLRQRSNGLILTSTGSPRHKWRTKSKRFRSHSNTWPFDDAERRALYELEMASIVIGLLCPKNVVRGCKSTDFAVIITAHTEIVQSMLAVTRVLESTKIAADI